MKPQHLLSSLGISSNRKGYWFTSRSLELALEDENRLILLQIVGLNGHLCHIRRTV